ncbi:hypothetical protein A2643_03675 [Candidatus Nomurabacteria bacterium RIFCSPHIGHO2_01_FULL_39_220]|uniref:Serine protease n=1 Tax=Candidatus Nomurabacteria bacterium RIFCSPLOWO2_02_FULL_40_67 TaxID=1801787 RepID=A0A1F6Y3H1_9BACT|nr:MAG: hypothetical protein UU01_C0017G0016 [Parcubacteria group bacterium GW2011_GWA2_40_37]KKS10573.1 MAG: hypothetical protein UU66_C0044G0003 [Parcubacteria group bacterium GW2011_GWB1_41_5]OGI62504.1 MAG: hypothetical protein A2W12_01155 [Candidatus Nomurabacteria bacterium RBG_16_40_11]OGI69469.1 MAG: hypothetical protein A2643_03675 [Candidatus Nomurabacteria bacterium RIFCSPHIGHO2_01_FULL_39_220]OGI72772.1 MAG: hypothetical protein A2W56_03475 [Candidatus Nomurabacteria bacterium RIFCS
MKIFVSETKRETVAVLVVCFLVALTYLGTQAFNSYKTQKVSREELELQKEQAILDKEKLRDQELADLKQQLLVLKNKPPEVKTVTNTITVGSDEVIAKMVKEWSPRVAHMECSWFNGRGDLYATASGSATLVNFTGLGLRAVTSRHLLVGTNNYTPRECDIELTNEKVYTVSIKENNVNIGKNEDWAYISLPADSTLTAITKQNIKLCPSVEIGDKLLVLGYPKIGAKTGLTITDGIVSGIDKNYFITSAKIDKGNSGGAAILVKDDCYLGIPSSSAVGVIESLGRILKASFVIGS